MGGYHLSEDKIKEIYYLDTIVMTVTFLLSECSFGEMKIEYEELEKVLYEGEMNTIMPASDEGYA
ncbi:DUF3952 domain-containing protein [Bacillus luti]